MAQYYLVKDNQRVGPFEANQLLANGLTPETLVWTQGMAGWVKAAEVPEVAALFAPAAPVPQPAPAAPAPQPAPMAQPAAHAPQPAPMAQPQYQQPAYRPQAPVAPGNMVATPQMGFMDAVKTCFKKYADFNGRARRSEFWWFYLACYVVNAIITIPLKFLLDYKNQLIQDAIYGGISRAEAEASDPTKFIIILGILMVVVTIALFIPQLAAMCRRLHDVGKSGNLLWLFLLCGVGGLVPLIMCIPDGNPAPNQYGESPKYVSQP